MYRNTQLISSVVDKIIAPDMAFFGAMLTDFPFALAKDFQACGIDNDMGNRAMTRRSIGDFHSLASLLS
ncbi:TPA: hypothetical protein ACVU1O_002718 [Vibrio cholerae]|nr:hypothetical protein [Vibrio vulnificus]